MRSLLTAAILLFASLSWGSSAVITTSSIPSGTALLPYSASISAEGECQRYEWTITPLPTGLIAIVQTSSIAISGTPSIAGKYSFTVSVKGCGGHIASKTYALTIGRDDWTRSGDPLLPEQVR